MTADVRRQLEAAGAKLPAPAARVPLKAPRSTTEPPQGPNASQGQEITFCCVVPGNNGPNGLMRAHWTERGRLIGQYEWIITAARLRHMPGPVRLELIRYSTGPQMDYDNLVSTGKLLIDALVRCRVLEDDKPTVIAERVYTQERAASKDAQRTVIRLTDLATPTP